MKPLIASLMVLACAFACSAQDPEFTKLQTNYRSAVTRAVEPINKTYEAELRKLLERQTRAKNLEGAKETMAAIEELTKTTLVDNGEAASLKEFEKFLVNRSWKMVGGSVYNFRRGGEGQREERGEKTPFLWRIKSPGIAEVSGNLGQGGTARTFYFRVVSLKEAYYGDSPDATNLVLTLE